MQSTSNDEVLFDRTTTKPLSDELSERSRKNFSTILRALSSVGQVHAAAGIGVHESTMCKWKDGGELERTAKLLAVLGIRLITDDMKVVRASEFEAILQLAKARMAEMTLDQLVIED